MCGETEGRYSMKKFYVTEEQLNELKGLQETLGYAGYIVLSEKLAEQRHALKFLLERLERQEVEIEVEINADTI